MQRARHVALIRSSEHEPSKLNSEYERVEESKQDEIGNRSMQKEGGVRDVKEVMAVFGVGELACE